VFWWLKGILRSGFKIKTQKFKFNSQSFCLLLCLIPFLSFGQNEFRKVENKTFSPGEFLKYRVFYDSWMTSNITAGYGTMEIDPLLNTTNGRETYHITVTGNSAGLFNLFYKVRDRFETFVDTEGMMPLKFIRRTREGGYKRDDDVTFDHVSKIAQSRRATKEIPAYVQDIVSAFYYVRTWDFDTAEVDDAYLLDFFLDDSLYHSEIIFEGREWVDTEFGEIYCLKFKPKVAVGEIFQEPYPMELWVSDDLNKIPVLMRSAVFIGSVKIELVEYKGLRYPPLGTK
jgi:hypothetical protein